MLPSTAGMNRAWRRIGLVVLCIVGTDLSSPQIPGAFWIEDQDLYVESLPRERDSEMGRPDLAEVPPATLPVAVRFAERDLARRALLPAVPPELRHGARPLRLALHREAPGADALDSH